jgi:hypothetical protein
MRRFTKNLGVSAAPVNGLVRNTSSLFSAVRESLAVAVLGGSSLVVLAQ